MPQSIALIGECMIELHGQPGATLQQNFGGDTFNTAAYLARLIADRGWRVEYVSALGRDTFSDAMLARWAQEQVHHRLTARLDAHLPGLYIIETDTAGERRFHYWRSESAARLMFDDIADGSSRLEQLCAMDVIYLSGISLAILTVTGRARLFETLAKARQGGTRVVFDNNYRPRLWPDRETAERSYRQLLNYVDTAIVTEDDDRALYGHQSLSVLIDWYADKGVSELVIKRGAGSCVIVSSAGREEVVAEQVAQVVDTTAAGDAFSAGYLACRLQGGSRQTAASWGHRLAATVIQHRGAVIERALMPEMPALG
ncbi:2-dehydro-3-deoxygluconokinase [Salinisphaera aquimarina]|uniref:Sugar kinase n=1 Tax=Salinisphaera aquimarina TaxID=2094031 RepID=A0ABV7EKL5_9GAMM